MSAVDERPKGSPLIRWRARRGWPRSYSRSGDGPWRAEVNRPDGTMGPGTGRWPRWVHRWYARTRGYFWLPCPICGRETGGHEWGHYDGKSSAIHPGSDKNRGIGICPSCTRAGYGD